MHGGESTLLEEMESVVNQSLVQVAADASEEIRTATSNLSSFSGTSSLRRIAVACIQAVEQVDVVQTFLEGSGRVVEAIFGAELFVDRALFFDAGPDHAAVLGAEVADLAQEGVALCLGFRGAGFLGLKVRCELGDFSFQLFRLFNFFLLHMLADLLGEFSLFLLDGVVFEAFFAPGDVKCNNLVDKRDFLFLLFALRILSCLLLFFG
mmetsp:Transcript_55053/g.81694  ORF Transcript_55053/g.81694 Transcript_55053/m.81694 type:complete len:208 (-) Transcript_55053:356-979(-)